MILCVFCARISVTYGTLKENADTIEVIQGLYLSRVGEVYRCYFWLGGKQFRRSTKTGDLGAAKLKALTWYHDAQGRLARGEQVESVSFAKLKRSYLDHIKHEGKHGYHAATIERHFLPFFANFDDISKITRSDLLDYLKFRRAQGDKAPMPQTINRKNTVLRQMMRYAVDRNWLKSAPAIHNESERLTRRRRRQFTIEEYRKLYRTARKQAKELDGVELKTVQSWQRKLLRDYVLILANTGLRVDEAKTLVCVNGGDKADHLAAQIQAIERAPSGMARAFSR